MDLLSVAVLLIAGCAAGLLAGFFGIDIGILTLPLLLVWYSSTHVSTLVAAHLALGTTLIVSCLSTLPSTAIDYRGGFVVWKDATQLVAAGILGGIAGGMVSGTLSFETLARVFGVVFFAAGIQLFGERRKPRDAGSPTSTQSLKLSVYGLLSGFVVGLTGVANKLLMQPLLYTQMRIPLKRSQGTSNASSAALFFVAALVVAVGGFSRQDLPPYALGYIDTFSALPLSIGATLFVHVGRRLGEGAVSRNARLVLGILLIGYAIKILVAP